jgi:hypothetical protein
MASPDDLPRSPSGRVPEWVLREARGERADAGPFRAMPTGPRRRRRRLPRGGPRRWGRAILVGSVLAVLAVGAAIDLRLGVPFLPELTSSSGGEARPSAGQEEGDAPPPVVTSSTSMSYAFLAMQPDGSGPVTWSPCRPIHWVESGDDVATIGGHTQLVRAFDDIAAATGLRFVYDGVTDEPGDWDRPAFQPDRYGDRWAPVLVAWAHRRDLPDLDKDAIAAAKPEAVSTPSGDIAMVTGQVRIDVDELDSLIIAGHLELVRGTLTHELGHLVGLDHVDDPTQLMYPVAQPGRDRLAAGDLAGLALVGQGPCQPDV